MSFVRKTLDRLRYLYRGGGVANVIRHAVRQIVAPVYRREVYYLLIRRVGDPGRPSYSADNPAPSVEYTVVDNSADLAAIKAEISPAFRHTAPELKAYTDRGCLLTLARAGKSASNGQMVIGYLLQERAVLPLFGRHHTIARDMSFGRYCEVLPEFRGLRINLGLAAAFDDYCLRHGIRKHLDFIGLENAQALKAANRAGREIAGIVERVSLCGGWIGWETPWEKIKEMLES